MSAGVSPNCGDARGGLFDNNTSSTWKNGQEQFLGLDAALGYQGEGQYGMSSVSFIRRNEVGADLLKKEADEI